MRPPPHSLLLLWASLALVSARSGAVAQPLAGAARAVIAVAATNLPAAPDDIPPELRRGWQLAHVYCQACHLFPEPVLLDKATWTGGVARKMAPMMGVAHLNLANRPDGKILAESGIFPGEPMLPEADWRAIWSYYQESAPASAPAQPAREPIRVGLNLFRPRALPNPGGASATTLVKIDPAARLIYAGDAQARTLNLFAAKGDLLRRIPVESGPVSLTIRPEGLYLTLIGHVFPSDEPDGKLILLRPRTNGWVSETILDHLRRPTEVNFADLNSDGRPDLVVSEFGNYLGALSWYENLGGGRYEAHPLLERPGALGTILRPMAPGGPPDVFALMAQAREGVYRFANEGGGRFKATALVEFPPVYGSTHMEMADFNGDGFPDLLVTCGDNGEYPSPFKNYHGVRIFLNDGRYNFHEAWFYPVNGAFKAVAADFDGDGDLDLALISYFADYARSPEESFIYFENLGGLKFQPRTFAGAAAGRWLTMDVGDIDGDGDLDIVLGSFPEGPPSIRIPDAIQSAWKTNHTAVLVLENQLR